MTTAAPKIASSAGSASALMAMIARNDFAGAMKLNEVLAAEMPFSGLVERWFVGKIAAQWPQAKPKEPWAAERARQPEAKERCRAGELEWWEDHQAIKGKDRLADLSVSLARLKAKEAEPPEDAAGQIMLPAVVPPPPPLQPPKPNLDEAIAAMNTQHAIIENVGGKTVIASWEPSPIDLERLMVVFQSKESFLLRYSNRSVTVEVADARGGTTFVKAPLGQWWLSHRDRLQFRGVVFRPGGPKVVSGCLNLWRGWGVEAKPGNWRLIRDHIEDVIAGGNGEFAEYVLRWIAWSIQNPAAQAEVALVLIGEKGAGKGTLVRCLQRIFGAHAFQVTTREHVIDKFNGHLQDCILFIVDEAYWGGDKRCVGRLQGMITEPTLSIERKGLDVIEVPNYLHVVMLAEPGWVIPAGRFERRYAALEVSTGWRGDHAYFSALHRQIAEGGAEAMFHELGQMELGDWHPRQIPESLLRNKALQEQQVLTLPAWEQWYLMLLHEGKLPGALPNRRNTAGTRALVENAKRSVGRLHWEASDVALRNFLTDSKRLGVVVIKYRDCGKNGWSFPPLVECRAAWVKMYGAVKWDHETKEWG
jgi:Family of unknown function (DUF5906)